MAHQIVQPSLLYPVDGLIQTISDTTMPAHNPFSIGSVSDSKSDPKSSIESIPASNSSLTSDLPDRSETPLKSDSQEAIDLDSDSVGFARKVNEFHGHRAMKIWLIIMISLRIRPISSVHDDLWRRRARFRNLFRERLRYIKANLAATPQSGLILHLPNHPGADEAEDLEDQYVDVHSAISVLRRKYDDLPPEMDALEASVANSPISASWYADGAQPEESAPSSTSAADGSGAGEGSPAKRDQTRAVASRMNNNLHKLLLHLVEHHYGTLAPQTLNPIRDKITQDIQTPGMGPAAIESQLKQLMAHRDSTSSD